MSVLISAIHETAAMDLVNELMTLQHMVIWYAEDQRNKDTERKLETLAVRYKNIPVASGVNPAHAMLDDYFTRVVMKVQNLMLTEIPMHFAGDVLETAEMLLKKKNVFVTHSMKYDQNKNAEFSIRLTADDFHMSFNLKQQLSRPIEQPEFEVVAVLRCTNSLIPTHYRFGE